MKRNPKLEIVEAILGKVNAAHDTMGGLIYSDSKKVILDFYATAIAPHEWLQPFENDYRPLKEEYLGLEFDKKPLTKAKTEALASVRTRWLGR